MAYVNVGNIFDTLGLNKPTVTDIGKTLLTSLTKKPDTTPPASLVQIPKQNKILGMSPLVLAGAGAGLMVLFFVMKKKRTA